MSSESSNVCRISWKAFLIDLPTSSSKLVVVSIPVSCDGSEQTHSWEFNWASSCQVWSRKHNGVKLGRYTYNFSLSGKQENNFKYERSFYDIKITFYNTDVVLAEKRSDLMGKNYNQFKFNKEVAFSPYLLGTVMVEVTLRSYVVESPTRNSLKPFLESGSLTDIVIKTKGKYFPCHKLVLASASEYFERMFEVDMREKIESVVNWVDVFEKEVVQDLLHYLYTGQTPPNFPNTCLTLLELAHMCLMDGLKALCAHQLKNVINVENMGDILRVAVKNESKELQEIAVNFIVQNYDIKKHPAPWDQIGPEFVPMLKSMVAKKILL